MKNKRTGFTLIELLVVIAIIALLAAILFPVFMTAREKARQSSCQNNEKQIGVALMQYTEDYDERVPLPKENNASWGCGWAGTLNTYAKSAGIYLCPDGPKASPVIQSGYNTAYPVSYAMNANIVTPVASGHGTINNGFMPNFNSPGSTVCLVEVAGAMGAVLSTNEYPAPNRYLSPTTTGTNPPWGDDNNGSYCSAGGGGPCYLETGAIQNVNWVAGTAAGNNGPALGWHSNGSNVLFLDGHVKWLMGTQISAGTPASSPTSNQGTGGPAAGTANGIFAATFSTI